MLGISCGLEVSEMVLIEHRNPDETDEGTPSGSLNDVSISNVLMESVRMESRPCSNPSTAWSGKELSSQPGSRRRWLSDDILPVKPG